MHLSKRLVNVNKLYHTLLFQSKFMALGMLLNLEVFIGRPGIRFILIKYDNLKLIENKKNKTKKKKIAEKENLSMYVILMFALKYIWLLPLCDK